MYVLTNYVGTTQNYKKFIDYQTQKGILLFTSGKTMVYIQCQNAVL